MGWTELNNFPPLQSADKGLCFSMVGQKGRGQWSSCTYTYVPTVCVPSLAVAFACAVLGLLNPLDSPHHMRVDEDSEYREGVVLDRPTKPGRGSFVNCGMRKVCLLLTDPKTIFPVSLADLKWTGWVLLGF